MRVSDAVRPAASPGPPARATAPDLWILAVIVAVAAIVRFASLDAAGYWLDEAYSVIAVRGSLGDAWHAVVTTESTPPLYYLLGWGWAEVFGASELGLRSLSALCGVALVPVVWLAGRELLDRRAALVAAALVASSPLLVWYSQEARAYELLVLLCTVAFWQLARARRGAVGAAGWWALAAALALATHYVAIFPVLAEAALLLWWRRDRAAVVAVAAVGVVGAALIPVLVTQRGNALANESPDGPLKALAQLFKQFAVGYDLPWEVGLTVAALALALGAVVLLRFADRAARRGAGLAAAVGLASPVGLLLVALAGQDQLMSRYMLPALPLLLLVLAAGFAVRRAGRWGLVAAGALCAVGLGITTAVAVTPADHSREDWRGAANVLATSSLRPRAIVLFPPSGQPPLGLYVHGLAPPRPILILREVDLVDVTRGIDHRRDPPFALALAGNPAFRLVADRRTETAAVARYVAPVPSAITVISLLGVQAGGRQSSVLVQR